MFIRRHRLHVAPDDVIGDEGGQVGGLVAAVLDVVQRRGADLQAVLVDPAYHSVTCA